MRIASLTLALLAGAAAESGGQTVLLELRPRLGDTLRMRFDQTTEMVGSRRGARPMKVSTSLTMFSRAIVEERTATATLIFAITDSVRLNSSDAQRAKYGDQAEAQLVGRRMRLRLSPNGVVALAESPRDVPKEVNDLIAVMPASFPAEPVSVGETWIREMPIPPEVRLGVPLGGIVRSIFRLDSLSRDSRFAYVSMRGALQTASAASGIVDTTAIGGSVDGSLVVDRRRGWLSESRFMVHMRSTLASTGGDLLGVPMQFRTTITQRMKVLERRP